MLTSQGYVFAPQVVYKSWLESIDLNFEERLEQHLLAWTNGPGSLLECNFDQALLRLFQEARYWGKLRMSLPLAAMDIVGREENYRVLRESVILLVRDYNDIILALTPEERRLFSERIQFLDSKVWSPPVFRVSPWLLTFLLPFCFLEDLLSDVRLFVYTCVGEGGRGFPFLCLCLCLCLCWCDMS